MKIKEVLEWTMKEQLQEIAKNRLKIGRNTARDALKAAGCYAVSGRKGWYYEGDPAVLEKSIYDFVATSKQKASPMKQNASIRTNNNNSVDESDSIAEVKANQSELDSIDRLLLQSNDNSQQRVYRGFYWDREVIEFLDSVKHGNKSDLMNEIVKTVLKNKGLI